MLRLSGSLRAFFLQILDGLIESLPDKRVGLPVETAVLLADQRYDF